VSLYEFLKFLHVLAAIVAVGTNVTYFVWLRQVPSQPEQELFILRGIRLLDSRLANPGYIALLVLGILLVIEGFPEFTSFWVAASLVLYVAVAVFGGVFFAPALRRQRELLESEGPRGPAAAAAARRTTVMGLLTMIPVLAIVFFMVVKPDL
jgi:uncharacterized membrane protein